MNGLDMHEQIVADTKTPPTLFTLQEEGEKGIDKSHIKNSKLTIDMA